MLACGTFTTSQPSESVQDGGVEQEENQATPTSTPITIPTPSEGQEASQSEQGLGSETDSLKVQGLAVAHSNIPLVIGERALVIAGSGVNVRENSSTTSEEIWKLSPGDVVEVLEGPIANESLFWWRIKTMDGSYLGMVAEGQDGLEYLAPAANLLVTVDRSPVPDDVVRVTESLNLRRDPGLASPVVLTLEAGQELLVVEGPVHQGGYDWFKLRNESGTLLGWSVSMIAGRRTLSPLE